jgi:hypothetical protein
VNAKLHMVMDGDMLMKANNINPNE